MAQTTVELQHPTLESVRQTVPKVDVDQWTEQGWRKVGDELKGAALDAALEAAGLSKSGTVEEKRARLAEAEANVDGEPSE